MSVMHEFERRADQHRFEALKKIDAVEQENADQPRFDEAHDGAASNSVDADKLTADRHQNAS